MIETLSTAKSTKLAAIYNVWDGDELLQGSIDQIRPHVDLVIVVWQSVSNLGEEYLPYIVKPPVDKYRKYTPDFNISPAANETRKRNSGLDLARELGATHFISMDCDEYYVPEEFAEAKKQVIEGGYDASACQLYTYYKYPTDQLNPPETYFVPFIHKIYPETRLGLFNYPVFSDPTRRVNTSKKFLKLGFLMHHFSFVRRDIGRKFRNSSSRQAYQDWQKHVQTFESYESTGQKVHLVGDIVKVPNRFGIRI